MSKPRVSSLVISDIPVGALDTTIRIKYPLSSHPELTTADSLFPLASRFGTVESSEIVISLKPAPPKKPKRGIALVPYKQISDAFAAVCASGREDRGLKDIEISWAEGKEPELIGWLKKMGKLGGSPKDLHKDSPQSQSGSPAPRSESTSTPFSTFPSSFVRLLSLMCLDSF